MRPSLCLVNGNFLAVTAQCRLQYPAALDALGALDCAEQLPRFEIKPAAVERSAMAPSRQRVMRRARARTVAGQAGRPRRAAVLPGIGPVPSPPPDPLRPAARPPPRGPQPLFGPPDGDPMRQFLEAHSDPFDQLQHRQQRLAAIDLARTRWTCTRSLR